MPVKSKAELLLAQFLKVASFVFILWALWQLSRGMLDVTIPFDTDEADHANSALELYTAIVRFDIFHVYQALVRQSFYPPLYSLFISISYLVSGPSLASSRVPTMLALAIYVASIFIAVRIFLIRISGEVQGEIALICACIASLLAVTSPISIYNSVLCMLEVPGMFFTTVCILAFLVYETKPVRSSIVLVCLSGLLVFFNKYNFGIITLPAIGLTLFFEYKGDLIARLKRCVFPGTLIISIIAAWVSVIDFHSFKHFFVGHDSYVPLLTSANLFFELRSWVSSYCINSGVAVVTLLLAIIGGIKYRAKAPVRFCALNTIFSFLVLALSSTNEERHFMVALPTTLFLAVTGLFHLVTGFRIAFSAEHHANFSGIIITGLFAVIVGGGFVYKLPEILENITKQYEGDPQFLELYDFINSRTDSRLPILVNGVTDDFGIETLRWMAAKSRRLAYTEVIVDSYPFRDKKNFTALKRKRNLDTPFKDKSFPSGPLSRVVQRNFYKYAVIINHLKRTQRFVKEAAEFRTVMQPFPSESKTLGDTVVTIYSLGSLSHVQKIEAKIFR